MWATEYLLKRALQNVFFKVVSGGPVSKHNSKHLYSICSDPSENKKSQQMPTMCLF